MGSEPACLLLQREAGAAENGRHSLLFFSREFVLTAVAGRSLKSHHVGTDVLFKIHESHSWIHESGWNKRQIVFCNNIFKYYPRM